MKNSHSEIKISPKTWEKNLKSNLKKEWYGYYYFYSTKYPLGKLIKFKGMNRIKNLEDRQNLTKYLINNEIDMLSRGYNPVTKEFETSDNFITEHTPFLKPIVVGAVFMFLGGVSAYFTLYLSAFIYKMGWLLYLVIFDQGFLAFFIILKLYKIIHSGHFVLPLFFSLFYPKTLYS